MNVAETLRVSITVDYVTDELPNPADADACDQLLEAILVAGLGEFCIASRDDQPIDFDPIGWRVDAGQYGDLGAGMAPERATGPRTSADPGVCTEHGGLMWSDGMRACITADDVIRGGCTWGPLVRHNPPARTERSK